LCVNDGAKIPRTRDTEHENPYALGVHDDVFGVKKGEKPDWKIRTKNWPFEKVAVLL
jgi:hypothetical protein